MSTREYGAFTLTDSMNYYDTKLDVLLRQRDARRVRAYAASIRRLVEGRSLRGGNESMVLSALAFAHATLGDTAAARRTLTQAIALARATAASADSFTVPGIEVPGTYARLGEPDTAARWIAAKFASRNVAITARRVRIEPKVLVLRGTPAFERFLHTLPE